jgi:hypothetical protein
MSLRSNQSKIALRAALLAWFLLWTVPSHSQSPGPNGFLGTVTRSDTQKPGAQFAFANLRMPHPFVTWPSGHGVETRKVFEDDELIVLLLVSVTGSTETFYLNKRIKRFAVVEAISATQLTESGEKTLLKVTHGSLR